MNRVLELLDAAYARARNNSHAVGPTVSGPEPGAVGEASAPVGWTIGEILADARTWRPVERIATGLDALDSFLDGGLPTGGVQFIAGKPKNCKTQVVVQIGLNAAAADVPVAIVSLEMPREEIARLALAQCSGVARRDLARGMRSFHGTLTQACAELKSLPIRLYDDELWPGGLTIEAFAELVGHAVGQCHAKLVILDYLGLLVPADEDRRLGETQLERKQSAVLRRIAREHGIALLVVAAVRKGAIFKPTKNKAQPDPLTLDDVRGSGGFGYDAGLVISVAKEYHAPPAPSFVKLHVLANRWGLQHDPQSDQPIRLPWQPDTGRIG